MARPQNSRIRRAQLRQVEDRVPDVVIRDVAEDAAHQEDIGRHGVREAVNERCVSGSDLDTSQPRLRSRSARPLRQLRVELDENGSDILTPRMFSQHPDEVTTLPRAEAEHQDLAGGTAVKCRGSMTLHEPEPYRMRRQRIVIPRVPRHPVRRHTPDHRGQRPAASNVVERGRSSPQHPRITETVTRAAPTPRQRRTGRTASGNRHPAPRFPPAASLPSFKWLITVTDDLGTDYRLQLASGGGSGMWRYDWQFRPGPPEGAGSITIHSAGRATPIGPAVTVALI